ncbi:Sec23-binding domain of Sec16-domain-containing protein [Cokeromyces recurvatus]|uniref:Sec23-binding domain of Sec16-domain-containing protein n=1 Tax=Cokeromyces recurvatus TaxID=90255 RepID=UPI00221EAEE0|nr:Sec23-binding domain of Sec16-domain-containing protein [Cokeromyces recurvatus]KAI7905880.1 Sec23-binding domain of Sec16-domain-containing protein [Cokeromyces recurvatus]
MTTPYNGTVKNEWIQFDPNVHYYYDEQGQLQYYDPNSAVNYGYEQENLYYNNQIYTPSSTLQQQQQQQQQIVNSSYTEASRQPTPEEILLPCPEPTCKGENKPASKFCEECGRPLKPASRSVTPAATINNNNNNTNNNNLINSLTKSFSNHQIHDAHHLYQPIPPLQRPPTAPVYSSSPLDSVQAVPLYDTPSVGNAVHSSSKQPSLYYNGVHHQSMQNLYGLQQEHQDYLATPSQYNPVNTYEQQQQPTVDPLDRAKGCPIVTFGFGGKMLVTFPRTVANYYSSTVKPQPGPIQIKSLKDFNLATHLQFPGPVLLDSKVGTKQKRKDVSHYITQIIDELEKQKKSSMIVVDSVEYHRLESKILLWQLMKVMIENDGFINDKDKMDQALLSVIRPKIDNVEESYFNLPSYDNRIQKENGEKGGVAEEEEDLSEYMLSKIEHYLLNGDRVGAVNYAIQEDLWAHALIISSCVNKELWQKVISHFVDREMNSTPEMRRHRKFNNIAGSNQALRVMYSLFSGAGPAAMKEFIVNDVQHVHTPYGLQTVTPPVDPSQLIKWRHTLAIILANRTVRDLDALTALGDIMKEQGWIEAAHICYLLSPQSSIHSGYDTVNVRMSLIGSEKPNLEAYYLTEIFEFANSCHTSNSTVCLPFLQGYKLAHAWILADYGYTDIAQRYYESIDQCIKSYNKGNPYLHSQLIQQVDAFGTYLENSRGKKTGVDPTSWLKPKFQKKTFSTLWGTLEGSLTKFVSGEEVPTEETISPRKSTEIMSRYP